MYTHVCKYRKFSERVQSQIGENYRTLQLNDPLRWRLIAVYVCVIVWSSKIQHNLTEFHRQTRQGLPLMVGKTGIYLWSRCFGVLRVCTYIL